MCTNVYISPLVKGLLHINGNEFHFHWYKKCNPVTRVKYYVQLNLIAFSLKLRKPFWREFPAKCISLFDPRTENLASRMNAQRSPKAHNGKVYQSPRKAIHLPLFKRMKVIHSEHASRFKRRPKSRLNKNRTTLHASHIEKTINKRVFTQKAHRNTYYTNLANESCFSFWKWSELRDRTQRGLKCNNIINFTVCILDNVNVLL